MPVAVEVVVVVVVVQKEDEKKLSDVTRSAMGLV